MIHFRWLKYTTDQFYALLFITFFIGALWFIKIQNQHTWFPKYVMLICLNHPFRRLIEHATPSTPRHDMLGWPLVDPREASGIWSPNSFIFMKFSAKNLGVGAPLRKILDPPLLTMDEFGFGWIWMGLDELSCSEMVPNSFNHLK